MCFVCKAQRKRIKIQAHYECRRSGTITRAFVLRLGSAAPLGLNECVPIINPGLAPWALQEYRPKGLISPRKTLPVFLVKVSQRVRRAHENKYTHSLKRVRRIH